jgi:hypothetical protein
MVWMTADIYVIVQKKSISMAELFRTKVSFVKWLLLGQQSSQANIFQLGEAFSQLVRQSVKLYDSSHSLVMNFFD